MARRYGVRPTAETQLEVARLVNEFGIHGAAQRLGVGQNSTARLAVGAAVLKATLALVDERLAAEHRCLSAAAYRNQPGITG